MCLEVKKMKSSKQEVKKHIISCVNKTLTIQPTMCVGFGSFWQCQNKLKEDSDIDIFLLFSKLPSLNEIIEFKSLLQDNSFDYEISIQIFVGNKEDLVSGDENILRILTMYAKDRDKPFFIIGKEVNLLKMIDLDNIEKINEALRRYLFKITRLYTKNINKNNTFNQYKEKEIQRLYEAIKVIIDNNTII